MTAPYIPLGDDWQVSEVTPWFPGSVRPVHDGLYQIQCRRNPYGLMTAHYKTSRGWNHFIWSCCEWRGLAQEPKGKP